MHRPEIPRPIHPFPARMAASIPWSELRSHGGGLRVLDPMAGSGTTLVVARRLGHAAIGFDTDPLAVLLARAWCSDVREKDVLRQAESVLKSARRRTEGLLDRNAYPLDADEETRAFVRYWFNQTNRRQLAALARALSDVSHRPVRDVLWCAFSRMIITKQAGVSRALDVAHSRPHKSLNKTTTQPFDQFLRMVRSVLAASPFKVESESTPHAVIRRADARRLPLEPETIDVVVSSPPYVNAIDYLRAHKFSLVWMGHSVVKLRHVRATNVGTEVGAKNDGDRSEIMAALDRMGDLRQLPLQQTNWLRRFVADMDRTLGEMYRVLVPGGRAVLVIGDCTMRDVFVRNSAALAHLSKQHGFEITACKRRRLPPNRRYLPPPSSRQAGPMLQNRLRTEVLLHLAKPTA